MLEWSKISHGDESASFQIFSYFLSIFSGKIFFSFQLVEIIDSYQSGLEI